MSVIQRGLILIVGVGLWFTVFLWLSGVILSDAVTIGLTGMPGTHPDVAATPRCEIYSGHPLSSTWYRGLKPLGGCPR
jgi:hypothetical protein